MAQNGTVETRGGRPRVPFLDRLRPGYVPIAIKMALAISLLIVLGMTGLGLVILNNQTRLLQNQISAYGMTIVNQMAEAAKEPILAGDTLTLEMLATNLAKDPAVLGTAVFSVDGKLLAKNGLSPFDPGAPYAGRQKDFLGPEVRIFEWRQAGRAHGDPHNVSFVAPVRFRDVIAGYVTLTFSRGTMNKVLQDSVRVVLAATVFMILVGIGLAFFMGRRLSRPIRHLMDASRAIGEGDYRYRIRERRNDELGYLIASFNQMAEGLLHKTQVEAAFSRYLSPEVAREVLDNLDHVELGGKHVTASVLFADIVGYTSLSEKMKPDEVVRFLNAYFSLIARAGSCFQGTVDKYMGDCAMLVFGAPQSDPEHCFHAVGCAVLIQRLVAELNRRRTERGEVPVEFRMGINTGEMLAGNMGSRERMQYTVVGDAVNLASRLCSTADPGQVVIPEHVHADPAVRERVIARPHAAIRVRGRTDPVTTYVVQGVVPEVERRMQADIERILAEAAA
ncbi:HAMP domain-containing protein [Dissulfurirhabdus thermomarina]|uniref:HAMP domain-containing protein n=1 Tax=Dissulfurirhabdus thermomarina TaxID=1765737 RepID=A0A6N9TRC7_DISTH|nr:adenylate/guanylate cyclase domain-containing protein [Dissulfurirhabdus thermomarina]NDY42663.1 HAMP domain-containing protein [Dissulfurirhabdus thermomarina]NMX23442.1 HAMP domain-containing protein [Dissulfurirhabdus thermomarina]